MPVGAVGFALGAMEPTVVEAGPAIGNPGVESLATPVAAVESAATAPVSLHPGSRLLRQILELRDKVNACGLTDWMKLAT